VNLRVLAGRGAGLETKGAFGRVVVQAFAAVAECERDLIAERTRLGLASAHAKNRHGGRPFRMTADQLLRAQDAMARREMTVDALCADLGIARQTLYRHLDASGQLRPAGEKLLRLAERHPGAGPRP
jgi:DNA invertase Pin-like site-specific DNA recombinase